MTSDPGGIDVSRPPTLRIRSPSITTTASFTTFPIPSTRAPNRTAFVVAEKVETTESDKTSTRIAHEGTRRRKRMGAHYPQRYSCGKPGTQLGAQIKRCRPLLGSVVAYVLISASERRDQGEGPDVDNRMREVSRKPALQVNLAMTIPA